MTHAIRTILVTGGAGFIGSALCRRLVAQRRYRVINLDKLTYSGNLGSLSEISNDPSYSFRRADIGDAAAVSGILEAEEVDAIIHLAAESHVDRSIASPSAFVETNVTGTVVLLEAALNHWRTLPDGKRESFRFHHVSTDEVFGDLTSDASPFTSEHPYAPSSPYAASKAASDHFARAWHRTYGLPVILSHASNNYGPFQYPEKLIPTIIASAVDGRPLPVYGDGANVRDWLFVDDHAAALELICTAGQVGSTYLVGGRSERSNLQVVESICSLLDQKRPLSNGGRHRDLVHFVKDRPGHDRRYAVDPAATEIELGWHAEVDFEQGLEATVDWYLENESWWRPLWAPPAG